MSVIYVGGQHAYLKYGWETSFKGGSTNRNKVIGRGASIEGLNPTVDTGKIPELGTIEPKYMASRRFAGTVELRWILSNPWFLKAVYGSVSTTGSSPPYTHTFSLSPDPVTMEIEVGIKRSTFDVLRLLKGCIPTRFGISFSANEDVGCTMSLPYASESHSTGSGTPAYDSFAPFKAAQAKLQINGSDVAGIQSIGLTFEKNAAMQYVIGSRYPEDVMLGLWDVSGRFTGLFHNTNALDELLNVEDWETVSVVISNGKTGSDEVSITFNLNTVKVSSHNLPIAPNAPIVEEVEIQALTSSAVAKNAESSVP